MAASLELLELQKFEFKLIMFIIILVICIKEFHAQFHKFAYLIVC